MKICNIIGTRPQIIKYSAIQRELVKKEIQNITIDSGQHYDFNMSGVFYLELNIPIPEYNLNIRSGSHAYQVGNMLINIEKILNKENPDIVLVYGDTNTTLAGAIAASKLHIPAVHIESGLRSFNKLMPEEINRLLTDHISTLLFCPTQTAMSNLKKEGLRGIYSGDLMYDSVLHYSESENTINRVLLTIHRDFNTDNKDRLNRIITTINELSKRINIIFPIHPRTKKALSGIILSDNIKIIEPVSYLEMLTLIKQSRFVITDSGGVQREAYFFNKPSIILRKETEWTEIINNGNSLLVDDDELKIKEAFNYLMNIDTFEFPLLFGDGNASGRIIDEILKHNESTVN
jgi:UDP-GlcNAc3NAcA epimerase